MAQPSPPAWAPQWLCSAAANTQICPLPHEGPRHPAGWGWFFHLLSCWWQTAKKLLLSGKAPSFWKLSAPFQVFWLSWECARQQVCHIWVDCTAHLNTQAPLSSDDGMRLIPAKIMSHGISPLKVLLSLSGIYSAEEFIPKTLIALSCNEI